MYTAKEAKEKTDKAYKAAVAFDIKQMETKIREFVEGGFYACDYEGRFIREVVDHFKTLGYGANVAGSIRAQITWHHLNKF